MRTDSFLAPMNPAVTLTHKKSQQIPTKPALLFDFRALLAEQPPLGKNERIPVSLALNHDEPAISFSSRPNFVHIPLLNLYIPSRHALIRELAELELAYPHITTAHGTLDSIRKGCNGPVCRRLARASRAEALQLRKTRNRKNPRQGTQAPQYSAVEPLLTAYTILSHYLKPAPNPSKLSKTFKACHLATYLKEQFPGLVQE